MVVFTCNHCGESLKKNHVEKHKFRCKQSISVSCMDCFKDFYENDFNSHATCLTEAERYSGKDYVPKPGQNKGQKKQEAWVDMIRSIGENNTNLSEGVKNVLQTISSYDNIPQKKAKFLNFMKNSFKYFKQHDLEEAWNLLEIALKENKPQQQNGVKKDDTNGIKKDDTNGVINDQTNGIQKDLKNGYVVNGKRKFNEEQQTEENGTKSKKKRTEELEVAEEMPETFNWTEVIRSIVISKNNEIKLSKLKKKVLNRYKKFSGNEISDKLENKFSKKLKKANGIVVDEESMKVRFVE